MKSNKVRRVTREPTASELAAMRQKRRLIAAELPDLESRDQMRKEARDEPTLSGELRRAVHASGLGLAKIAAQAEIPVLALDEFLTGERTLRSDVLDRLASKLGLELSPRR